VSTVSSVVDIIEAYMVGAVPTATILPRYECKVDPADLPAFIILPLGAVRANEGFRNYNATRDYSIYMLIAPLCDDKPQQQQEARETGWAYLDTVPDHFVKYPMLNDQSTGIVVDNTLPRDEGVQITSWGGDSFTAIQFRISVTTSKEVS
jgi:hypothetical protein